VLRFRTARVVLALAAAGACVIRAPAPSHAEAPPPLVDVFTWGLARSGQLGDVPPNTTVPWPIHEVKRWVMVASSAEHTLALTADGEVWAWGKNSDGQLGDGTRTDSVLPVKVPLVGVTQIAAGTAHSLAYRASDGALFAWGSNARGQLARPSDVASSAVPVAVIVPGALTAIATGSDHNLVLSAAGAVYAWGPNDYGQLGLGDFVERRTPVQVPLPEVATAVAAGGSHSLAVLASRGEVYGWGWNVFGQLGRGVQGTPPVGEPVAAPALGITDAVAVSVGDLHSLALTRDGHVFAWGYNTEGQVGNGDYTPAYTGVLAPSLLPLDSVRAIDAGGLHSVALKTNGELWAWGNNQFGACGDNARLDRHLPVPVVGLGPVVAAAAGGRHTIALAAPVSSTRLVGYGASSPLGGRVASVIDGPSNVAMLSSGFDHTLALDGDHRVWSWGKNTYGQLGEPGADRADAALVEIPLEGARGFVQVEARANRSFALRSDGVVFAWGEGSYGQTGLGTTNDAFTPTRVGIAGTVLRLAAGERHTLALDTTSTVWGWGQNLHGELGRPSTPSPTSTPVILPNMGSPIWIGAGAFHSLSIDLVGQLYAWGSGFRGQLGRGTLFDSSKPEPVDLPHDVTTASAGRFHTLVVRAGGVTAGFGDNTECQIADASGVELVETPKSIGNLPQALTVTAGGHHGVVLGYAGDVFAWGNDSAAQLGRTDSPLSHFDCDRARLGTAKATAVGSGEAQSYVVERADAP
jgi:alpha-tubulin suppressor-like RCC1 family protein